MRIISHIRLKTPRIKQPITEFIREYVDYRMKAAATMYKKLKKGELDIDTLVRRMIRPGIEKSKSIFRPGYVTQRGMSIERALTASAKDFKKWARRYKRTLLRFYGNKDELRKYYEHLAPYVERDKRRFDWPFRGYKNQVHGIGSLGGLWLVGDKTAPNIIPPGQIKLPGLVDIIKSRIKPSFRRKFTGKVVKWGKLIIQTQYMDETVQQANEELNQLVASYARDEFVPSTPGGNSHVNFDAAEAPDLYLDIQVAVK